MQERKNSKADCGGQIFQSISYQPPPTPLHNSSCLPVFHTTGQRQQYKQTKAKHHFLVVLYNLLFLPVSWLFVKIIHTVLTAVSHFLILPSPPTLLPTHPHPLQNLKRYSGHHPSSLLPIFQRRHRNVMPHLAFLIFSTTFIAAALADMKLRSCDEPASPRPAS